MKTLYVILVKSKVDVTKWGKNWPADPKIKSREGSKPIDKLIEQTIRAGDKFAKVKTRSLRFTDKNKKGHVEEAGPDQEEAGSERGGEGVGEGVGVGVE